MRWLAGVMLMMGCAHEPAEPLHDPQPRKRPPPPTAAPIVAPAPGDLSPLAKSLADVEYFAIGGVGITGATSPGETYTRALAKEPDAIAMFERLLEQPNRPARLYAYWALRTLDPDRANHHRAQLAADSTRIQTMGGCMRINQATSEVVADIDRLPRF